MRFRYQSLVFALVLAIAFFLSSCQHSVPGAQLPPTAEPTAAPTATPTPEPTPTPVPSPTPTITPKQEIYPITFGLSNSLSYWNAYFALALHPDDSWFAYTTQELDASNEMPNGVSDAAREEAYLDYLTAGNAVRDYYIHSQTGQLEIDINVFDYTSTKERYPDVTDYHTFYQSVAGDMLLEGGAILEQNELTSVVIAGKTRSCWRYNYIFDGYTTYCAHVMLQEGDYLLSVFACSIEADYVDELLAMFQNVPDATAEHMKPGTYIDAFQVGSTLEHGFESGFFGFGFRVPDTWYAYDSARIDLLNMMETDRSDPDAYNREYIDRLKEGETLYEYCTFETDSNSLALVFAADFSAPGDEPRSELSMLNIYKGNLFDMDHDGTVDIQNLQLTAINLLGEERLMYRFEGNEVALNDSGALLALKHGTTFEIILISCENGKKLDAILDGFYTVPQVPQV